MKKLLMAGLATALSLSCLGPTGAEATSYIFKSDIPGENIFYQSTSTSNDYIADSDKIVVGIDGVVSGEAYFPSDPLPSIDLPVGVYPDAWGTMTDISIAQNSIFMNENGPSTQTLYNYNTTYYPYAIPSGAIPTGGVYGSAVQTVYPLTYDTYYSGYNTYAGAYGNFSWGSIGEDDITALNSNGAIAALYIPAIGLNDYVYKTTSTSAMNKGIGHFTATPVWGGNIGLCGHNNPSVYSFSKLRNATLGMECYYTTTYGVRAYIISSIDVVSVDDVSGLYQDGRDKLTMYTCVEGQPSVRLKVVATAAY